MGTAVRGNWGHTSYGQMPSASLLDGRLPVTLSLVTGSTAFAAVAGVALGTQGALGAGVGGRAVDGAAVAGLAIPNFFLGLLLIAWFAVTLRIFPATGYVPVSQSPVGWIRSLVLPVVTLAVPGVAVVAKQTRDAMRGVFGRPVIRALRAAGVARRTH